uniref:Syntaxin N-terminal domain-containing protein n=1 Tax=Panagrolaimus superbus TaxID=310955 RepID=A0A914Z9S8_9BILA
MQEIDKDVRATIKNMKKKFRTLVPAKKGPLSHEDFSQMATMIDAFRGELQGLSQVLNNALSITTKQETEVQSEPKVIRTSNSFCDSGNESSCSEKSFNVSSSPSASFYSPTLLNEDFTAHIARLAASRVSRRIKGEELRLSLEKSQAIQEEIKKRFAETKARRDSLGQ